MSSQKYLIDTNVIIGLEDNQTVEPAFANLLSVAARHKVGIFVHEAAKDDIARDKDDGRRKISLSKVAKFQLLKKVRGLSGADLEGHFGRLPKPNDIVDATLLHALTIKACDFLVTEDKGLHERARRHSAELARRVLRVPDAVELLRTTFEPKRSPIRYVEETTANTIPLSDEIFNTLRADYAEFDSWWLESCVNKHRECWLVDDEDGIAGLIVRKDETPDDTDATLTGSKILKICTFKVRAEKRGIKLGELLLKKVMWFAQRNNYDVAYLTTFPNQTALIELLEYYGFTHTAMKGAELIYEKSFSRDKLLLGENEELFQKHRTNYPRFVSDPDVLAFGVPIREKYHDVLYPDLKSQRDLFELPGAGGGPKRPGNTIRKVYLCRAMSNLGRPGSLLFFYKGKSDHLPSQAFTAIGILEEVAIARSTNDLVQLAGGRSVYSEKALIEMDATEKRPVKVINYLLTGYIDPPVGINQLKEMGIFGKHPPQSVFELDRTKLASLLPHLHLGFSV